MIETILVLGLIIGTWIAGRAWVRQGRHRHYTATTIEIVPIDPEIDEEEHAEIEAVLDYMIDKGYLLQIGNGCYRPDAVPPPDTESPIVKGIWQRCHDDYYHPDR